MESRSSISIVNVERGREYCVARQSRSEGDDYEVRSEDLDDQGKVVRSVEVNERLTRDEASDDQREMFNHRVEMHESVRKGRDSSRRRRQSVEVEVVLRRW